MAQFLNVWGMPSAPLKFTGIATCMRVQYDDSIIQDTAAEKAQDMAEVGVTMHPWEYRQKWYGEDEKTAKARARGLKTREDDERRP